MEKNESFPWNKSNKFKRNSQHLFNSISIWEWTLLKFKIQWDISLKYSFHYNRYATPFLGHELFINKYTCFWWFIIKTNQQLYQTNNNQIVQEIRNYIDRKTSPLSWL